MELLFLLPLSFLSHFSYLRGLVPVLMRSSILAESATFGLALISARLAETRSISGFVAITARWARAICGLITASKFRDLIVRTLSPTRAIHFDKLISDELDVPTFPGKVRPFRASSTSETAGRFQIQVGERRPQPAEFRPRAINFAGYNVSQVRGCMMAGAQEAGFVGDLFPLRQLAYGPGPALHTEPQRALEGQVGCTEDGLGYLWKGLR